MSELYAKSRTYGPGAVGMVVILAGALLGYWNLFVGGCVGLVGVLIVYHDGVINMGRTEAISVGMLMLSAVIASVNYPAGALLCLLSAGAYVYSEKIRTE